MKNEQIKNYRNFLKDYVRGQVDFSKTDQALGIKAPPLQKPYHPKNKIVELPKKDQWKTIQDVSLIDAISERKSIRKYSSESLNLEELAFLLWSTQGISKFFDATKARRTVPSAGCRHAFETYLWVMNVQSIEPGLYRYLPIEHALVYEGSNKDKSSQLDEATLGQTFISTAPVTFIWSTIPYRMEWRYDISAHRVILMDVGHLCQNLYLACQAIQCGTCAIAAYDQDKMDHFINVDGEEEFVIYLAPVGKVS